MPGAGSSLLIQHDIYPGKIINYIRHYKDQKNKFTIQISKPPDIHARKIKNQTSVLKNILERMLLSEFQRTIYLSTNTVHADKV